MKNDVQDDKKNKQPADKKDNGEQKKEPKKRKQ